MNDTTEGKRSSDFIRDLGDAVRKNPLSAVRTGADLLQTRPAMLGRGQRSIGCPTPVVRSRAQRRPMSMPLQTWQQLVSVTLGQTSKNCFARSHWCLVSSD